MAISRPGSSGDKFRSLRRLRTPGMLVLATVGCTLAAWVLWHSWGGRVAGRPNMGPDLVQEPSRELDPPVATGMINARVRVREFDGSGNEKLVGEKLPERVSLNLYGAAGQAFEAQFDKVGMWAMEIPPGEYKVPRDQASLSSWEWTLSGANVIDEKDQGYRVVFTLGQAPTLELTLR